jgi:hydrogenase maturation factor
VRPRLGAGGRALRPGKIPIDVLEKTVLRLTGKDSASIVTPPKAGLDFAAVKVGSKYMVVSADPITGVTKNIGEYAIHVSANDVATSGNRPQFAETVVLLPEGSGRRNVGTVASQLDAAAKKLGMAIVGGHTEVTPSLERPIVMVTAFSFVDDYVTSGDAREGDSILMTKTAGLEGSAVLASGGGLARAVGRETVLRASGFLSRISIVEEAVAAYDTGFVNAMHDCTEGGVLGAVYEMSLASGLGFVLEEKAVPVAPETRAICNHLSLDPLKLIASGSILLSVKAGREQQVRSALKGVRVTRVGSFVKKGRVLVRAGGQEIRLRSAPEDELWRALDGAA